MKLFKNARRLAATMCSLVFFTSSALAGGGIDILIEGNESLRSLKGLKGVIAVNSLAIKSNSALTNLDALKNLEEVVGALAVETNTVLSRCEALAPVLGWPDGQNQGVGSATISGNATGCQTETEVLNSVLGPIFQKLPVITGQSFSIPAGTSGDTVIDMALAFNPAIEQEPLFPVYGHRAICNSSQSNNEAVARPLLDFTPVSPTLEMRGSAGGNASAFVAQIAVDINITHSDPVDLVVALKNPEGIPLVLWDRRSPNSEDLIGAFPGTLTPEEPLIGLARERMGGTWTLSVEDVGQGPIIREGTLNSWGLRISEESVTDGAVTSPITIKGIGHSVDYMCTLTALSRLGATPVSAVYLPPTIPRLPTQPTIRYTDYDDGEIILHALVSGAAGAAITRYDAVCTDGIATFSGSSTSSRIRVAGLTNGVAYTCKVTATNAVGSSPVSLTTSPITPMESEPSVGLPVYLLIQATH